MSHPFKPQPISLDKAKLRLAAVEGRYAGVPWPWLLLGDSRASGWPEDLLARFRRPVANIGLPGAGIQHVLWQLNQTALDLSRLRQAILVLGINHLTLGHAPEDVAQGLQHIVRTLKAKSPEVEVLVVEVFPRAPGDAYDEAARDGLNRRLQNRARNSGLFAYAPTRLSDPLDPGLFADGLHLTRAGYEVLTDDVACVLPPPDQAPVQFVRDEVDRTTVLVDLGDGAPLLDNLPEVTERLPDLPADRPLLVRTGDGCWYQVEMADGRFDAMTIIGYMPLADAATLARNRSGR